MSVAVSMAPSPADTCWRPLAHVAVRDASLRARISDALRADGWAVVDSPSGYHLVQRIAGPLFGDEPWWTPDLVVVDAFSPGCAGITIAHGLSDLGWSVATVLVVESAEHRARVTEDPARFIYVAERGVALPTVLEVARHRRRWSRTSDAQPDVPPDLLGDCLRTMDDERGEADEMRPPDG